MKDELQSNSVRVAPKGDYAQQCHDRRQAYKQAVYALAHSIPNGRANEMMRARYGLPNVNKEPKW